MFEKPGRRIITMLLASIIMHDLVFVVTEPVQDFLILLTFFPSRSHAIQILHRLEYLLYFSLVVTNRVAV